MANFGSGGSEDTQINKNEDDLAKLKADLGELEKEKRKLQAMIALINRAQSDLLSVEDKISEKKRSINSLEQELNDMYINSYSKVFSTKDDNPKK